MRHLARLSFVLCAALAACSASNNGGGAPIDAGVDAGEQDIVVVDETLTGYGTVVVTWTVNGMPPATGCAAAGAESVRLQVFFGRPETVPCTQGRYEAQMVSASALNVSADLLRADGTAIYQYNMEANVRGNQTTDVVVPFEPPGNLRVNWTVNGLPPSTECAAVGGVDVRFQGRRLMAPARPPSCGSGAYVFRNLQPGEWTVEGTLTVLASPTTVRGVNSQSGTATVPSGGTGEIELGFEAPQRDQ